ncbi:MAG: winged helix-turn-helix domain-containing protein [Gordonibacter pamelaeae]
MAFLAANPGKVFTRSQIQEYIWGEGEADVKTNSITVFVRKIREKIEETPPSRNTCSRFNASATR